MQCNVTHRLAFAVGLSCVVLVPNAAGTGTCLLQSTMFTRTSKEDLSPQGVELASVQQLANIELDNLEDKELSAVTLDMTLLQHASVRKPQDHGGSTRAVIVVTQEKRQSSKHRPGPTPKVGALHQENAQTASDTASLLTVFAQSRARRIALDKDEANTQMPERKLHQSVDLSATTGDAVVADLDTSVHKDHTGNRSSSLSNGDARSKKNATQIQHEGTEQWFVRVSKEVFESIQDEISHASGEPTANATAADPQHVKVTQTVLTVSIASPIEILSVYAVIYIPIVLVLAAYYQRGMKNEDLAVVGPFIMCVSCIANDMANKSLAMIMDSPDAISAIQGLSLFVGVGLYCLVREYRQRSLWNLRSILPWFLGVCPLFAGKFLLAQEVARYCSLSEAVVFKSLSTPCALIIELLVMPGALQPFRSVTSNVAVCFTVVGAVCFSLARPNFTSIGMGIAIANALAGVFYRIAQRRYLGVMNDTPISVLACVDGFVLSSVFLPLTIMQPASLEKLQWWITQPSVSHIVALSAISTITVHVAPLAVLQTTPATGMVVFDNMSSVVIIILSVYFFNDHLTGSVLGVLGLAVNLCSSFVYAWATQKTSLSELWKSNQKSFPRLEAS